MPLIRSESARTADRHASDPHFDGLTSAVAETRWEAVRASVGTPGAIPALVQLLAGERDSRVLEAIFTALARIGSPECVRALMPYIRSETASLRTRALDALRAMRALTASHLQECLSDSDSDVRLLACDLARELPGPEAAQLLCTLIETDTEANVCAAAVEVLSEIGDAGAIPSLAICAARFPDDPFLAFAIKTATDSLRLHADRD